MGRVYQCPLAGRGMARRPDWSGLRPRSRPECSAPQRHNSVRTCLLGTAVRGHRAVRRCTAQIPPARKDHPARDAKQRFAMPNAHLGVVDDVVENRLHPCRVHRRYRVGRNGPRRYQQPVFASIRNRRVHRGSGSTTFGHRSKRFVASRSTATSPDSNWSPPTAGLGAITPARPATPYGQWLVRKIASESIAVDGQ